MEPVPEPGPSVGDAFGSQLSDAYALRRPVAAFIERSDGALRPAGSAEWLADERSWPQAVRARLDKAEGRVLDAGAGAGRHATYLAGRSLDVTALDTSPLALDVCRRRGVERRVLGDVADAATLFREEEPFGTVLMLGNNAGLLGSVERGRRILTQLDAVTTGHARILAEGRRPGGIAPEDRRYAERNRTLGRLPGELLIRLRYRDIATAWFPYLFCDPDELAAIAEPTRWSVAAADYVEHPGDTTGVPRSYVAVLEKTTSKGGSRP